MSLHVSKTNGSNELSLRDSLLSKPKPAAKQSTDYFTDNHTDLENKAKKDGKAIIEENLLNEQIQPIPPKEKKPQEQEPPKFLEKWSWLLYAFGGCIFAAIGQFMMDWMSMGFESRFTIALGDFIFVFFYGVMKFLYNSYKKKSFCSFKDSEWCDPKTGKWKEGTFKYLLTCVMCRFGYGFLIIYALYLANENNMNGGLLFAIRTSEALFVAIWTRIFLKEKLTNSKILGLVILIAGVVGLSIPSKSDHTGFSVLAAILGIFLRFFIFLQFANIY